MTAPPPTSNGLFNLSQEIAVDLFNPPRQEKKIGILDIQADSIQKPPVFTEEETISAMKNLGISPDDLVSINYRTDDPVNVSEDSGMKIQIINELENKRLEAIKKIIAERNRIIMEGNIEVPLPKTIEEDQNDIDDDNDSKTTSKLKPPRKKKKGKSNLKSGNKKSKVKKKIKNAEIDLSSNEGNLNARNTMRRKAKPYRNSVHKFQAQKAKEMTKSKSSLSQTLPGDDNKPPTNRRPSVAERRQKYSSKLSQNQNNSIKNTDRIKVNERKNFNEYEANKKNDMMLINIRVKANEERRRMEHEEKQQLIKRQAQLRMQRQKDEENQFELMKKDRKSKAEEEMKRKERLYMKIQEKKMKALEQEKIKRQQKIYSNKIKQDGKNENEDRFSKLRQKLIEAQNNKANINTNHNNSHNNDDDIDLFSVTQPKNPKVLTVTSTNPSNKISSSTSKSGINNNNSVLTNRNPKNGDDNFDNQQIKNRLTANAKPLLSSTLNPPPVKKPLPQQNPKARSSLQNKNSAYYKQLLKLPVVGKNKTRIPCLRK